MGKLLLGLLHRSSFVYDPSRSKEDSYVSTHVFSSNHVFGSRASQHPRDISDWDLVIELRVYGTKRDRDRGAGFPARSTIEIECMGYPF